MSVQIKNNRLILGGENFDAIGSGRSPGQKEGIALEKAGLKTQAKLRLGQAVKVNIDGTDYIINKMSAKKWLARTTQKDASNPNPSVQVSRFGKGAVVSRMISEAIASTNVELGAILTAHAKTGHLQTTCNFSSKDEIAQLFQSEQQHAAEVDRIAQDEVNREVNRIVSELRAQERAEIRQLVQAEAAAKAEFNRAEVNRIVSELRAQERAEIRQLVQAEAAAKAQANSAATKIQAAVRGHQVREQIKAQAEEATKQETRRLLNQQHELNVARKNANFEAQAARHEEQARLREVFKVELVEMSNSFGHKSIEIPQALILDPSEMERLKAVTAMAKAHKMSQEMQNEIKAKTQTVANGDVKSTVSKGRVRQLQFVEHTRAQQIASLDKKAKIEVSRQLEAQRVYTATRKKANFEAQEIRHAGLRENNAIAKVAKMTPFALEKIRAQTTTTIYGNVDSKVSNRRLKAIKYLENQSAEKKAALDEKQLLLVEKDLYQLRAQKAATTIQAAARKYLARIHEPAFQIKRSQERAEVNALAADIAQCLTNAPYKLKGSISELINEYVAQANKTYFPVQFMQRKLAHVRQVLHKYRLQSEAEARAYKNKLGNSYRQYVDAQHKLADSKKAYDHLHEDKSPVAMNVGQAINGFFTSIANKVANFAKLEFDGNELVGF